MENQSFINFNRIKNDSEQALEKIIQDKQLLEAMPSIDDLRELYGMAREMGVVDAALAAFCLGLVKGAEIADKEAVI